MATTHMGNSAVSAVGISTIDAPATVNSRAGSLAVYWVPTEECEREAKLLFVRTLATKPTKLLV